MSSLYPVRYDHTSYSVRYNHTGTYGFNSEKITFHRCNIIIFIEFLSSTQSFSRALFQILKSEKMEGFSNIFTPFKLYDLKCHRAREKQVEWNKKTCANIIILLGYCLNFILLQIRQCAVLHFIRRVATSHACSSHIIEKSHGWQNLKESEKTKSKSNNRWTTVKMNLYSWCSNSFLFLFQWFSPHITHQSPHIICT